MSEAATILCDDARRWCENIDGVLVVGLCGAQGSGKSTVAGEAKALLDGRGLRSVILALDDLYLPKADRRRLAREVHPLLNTRGPPGTHDVALGLEILAALKAGRPARIPSFDKLSDDREPQDRWRSETGPFDVILFEGWCVGAAPEAEASLAWPINALEREEDIDCVWRRFVNAALNGPYRALFAQVDRLAMLQAPDFSVVQGWRLQQETANARAAADSRQAMAMDAAQVARFIQHYERITRWTLAEMPGRADLVIALDADRAVTAAGALHRPSPNELQVTPLDIELAGQPPGDLS